ncbi:MAG TPA: histidinol-phosphatase HisJ family protein [Clostridia bacterium]|nr:histidinol-phosphatase HisJ family protein [Clostridia bacterium]
MKVDTHTHSKFSADGREEIDTMVATAKAEGAGYIAITDHCDMDTLQEGNIVPVPWRQLDLPAYYADISRVQEKTQGICVAFGIEAGFDKRANSLYEDLIAKYPFDIVLNSVHFVDGWDAYFPYYFENKTKAQAYTRYLETVYDSLFVPYKFDIVGHVGYCVRNAPYEDSTMHYSDNAELIDKILLKIIKLDTVLEVNRHNGLVPNLEILQRYYDLGGRKIAFGSDAHRGDVLKDYDETCRILKKIGFTHFSIFKQHIEEMVTII